MGADDNILSNKFLPFGKARMGYPSGEARWGGADAIGQENSSGKGSASVLPFWYVMLYCKIVMCLLIY